jgi:hypothetical protein
MDAARVEITFHNHSLFNEEDIGFLESLWLTSGSS